ncbi:hypothetical protein GCM10028895_44450 [Pontibacter rugosus]
MAVTSMAEAIQLWLFKPFKLPTQPISGHELRIRASRDYGTYKYKQQLHQHSLNTFSCKSSKKGKRGLKGTRFPEL